MTHLLRLPNKLTAAEFGDTDRRREFFSCSADGTMCLWDGRSLRPRSTLKEEWRGRPILPMEVCLFASGAKDRVGAHGQPHATVAVSDAGGQVYMYDCDWIGRDGEHVSHAARLKPWTSILATLASR